MTKTVTTIYIDAEVLMRAKEKGINISRACEDGLKAMIEYNGEAKDLTKEIENAEKRLTILKVKRMKKNIKNQQPHEIYEEGISILLTQLKILGRVNTKTLNFWTQKLKLKGKKIESKDLLEEAMRRYKKGAVGIGS